MKARQRMTSLAACLVFASGCYEDTTQPSCRRDSEAGIDSCSPGSVCWDGSCEAGFWDDAQVVVRILTDTDQILSTEINITRETSSEVMWRASGPSSGVRIDGMYSYEYTFRGLDLQDRDGLDIITERHSHAGAPGAVVMRSRTTLSPEIIRTGVRAAQCGMEMRMIVR